MCRIPRRHVTCPLRPEGSSGRIARESCAVMITRHGASLILAVFYATLAPSAALAGGEDHSDAITQWLKVVQGEDPPTVSDFIFFEGSGAEWELQLERAECSRRGWTPPETSPECVEFVEKRYANPTQFESLYFERLRRLIPRDARLTGVNVVDRQELPREGTMPADLIRARVGEHDIEFYRPGEERGRFGRLGVNRLDGVDVDKLVTSWVGEHDTTGP